MTPQEFEKIFEKQMELSREVLVRKAAEYAPGEERLANFKTTAAFDQCTPVKACWDFMKKQIVSLRDLVHRHERGDLGISGEMWQERILDSINYLILLSALVHEARKAKFQPERMPMFEAKNDSPPVVSFSSEQIAFSEAVDSHARIGDGSVANPVRCGNCGILASAFEKTPSRCSCEKGVKS